MHNFALVLAEDPTGYSPAQLGSDLTTNIAQVLPYVGIAVGSVVGLMFALVGIKKGLTWARSLASRG